MDYKLGTKIRIIALDDPYATNYNGREGIITRIDSIGQLHGTWGGLTVIPGVDSFEVIPYEYTPLYYKTPCQVRWYEPKSRTWHGGIGYRDILIRGDGSVVKLDDVITAAGACGVFWEDAVVELEWLDLDRVIFEKE